MSGLPGKEDRLRDGKDECPVFGVSENGRVTHALRLLLLLLFAFVGAGCHYSGLHLSFSLSGRASETHICQNTLSTTDFPAVRVYDSFSCFRHVTDIRGK